MGLKILIVKIMIPAFQYNFSFFFYLHFIKTYICVVNTPNISLLSAVAFCQLNPLNYFDFISICQSILSPTINPKLLTQY